MKRLLGLGCFVLVNLGCGGPPVTAGDAGADGDGSDPDADAAPDGQPGGAVGEACTGMPVGGPVRGTCMAGLICLPAEYGYAGGYCSASCAADACPGGSTCVDTGQNSICMRDCSSRADCRFAEAYDCLDRGAPTAVCSMITSPIGRRADGSACYTTTPGPNELAPLPRTTFAATNLSASAERTDTDRQAEGNLAINPLTGAVAVPYIAAIPGSTDTFIGISHVLPPSTTVFEDGRVAGLGLTQANDPAIVYTADGILHLVFMGFSVDARGLPQDLHILTADSADDGTSWSAVRQVEPAGTCAAQWCDKPWIAVGPRPGAPTEQSLYVTYMAAASGFEQWVFVQRSDDAGLTWGIPRSFGATEFTPSAPNQAMPAVSADGTLRLVWLQAYAGADGPAGRWGDVRHEVRYVVSSDGGWTFSSAVRVSRATDAVTSQSPAIAIDATTGTTVHVAYVVGGFDGAWDVILATSADGGASWGYRRVNDEPDACATHMLPALAVDPGRGDVGVLWLDNRFGDGEAAFARCPSDAAVACGANEIVSDAPFAFTTNRRNTVWHGDYHGIAVAGASVWATWSDTRNGGPAMYLAGP